MVYKHKLKLMNVPDDRRDVVFREKDTIIY